MINGEKSINLLFHSPILNKGVWVSEEVKAIPLLYRARPLGKAPTHFIFPRKGSAVLFSSLIHLTLLLFAPFPFTFLPAEQNRQN